MSKLKGKIAVITGGNSGIGLETAKQFVNEGAKVVITGRNQKELDKAVSYIGANVLALQGDVSQLKDLERLFAKVKETHGKIDILFANAGVAKFASIFDVTEEHFDTHFNINVKGLFFTVQKALPIMNEGGAIILNASIAARIGEKHLSVYSATKAAVRSFARTLTQDLKDRKIRVNAVSPGPIQTPIFDKLGVTETDLKGFKDQLLSDSPLGRMGLPIEVAKAVVFLACDDSSYITGVDLCVDGGLAQV